MRLRFDLGSVRGHRLDVRGALGHREPIALLRDVTLGEDGSVTLGEDGGRIRGGAAPQAMPAMHNLVLTVLYRHRYEQPCRWPASFRVKRSATGFGRTASTTH
jgi:hypothetical protein